MKAFVLMVITLSLSYTKLFISTILQIMLSMGVELIVVLLSAAMKAMPQLTDRTKLPNIVDPVIRNAMDMNHLYQVSDLMTYIGYG